MKNYKLIITNLLKELGVPANINGYHHLRYAIELIMKDMNYMNVITKKLYPDVAKQFNSTPSRVERAILHAIEVSWYKGNVELQNKLFGYTVDKDKGKPTNSEFLITVADWLCLVESEGDTK